MNDQTNNHIGYRWLGAAGIELLFRGQSLLVDPYVTRVPWHHMVFYHVQPDRLLVKKLITRGKHIFVSHAHIDHLLDVSTVMEFTGASVYGSQNTCRLLRSLGVSETKIHLIRPGEFLPLDEFRISIYSAKHPPVPGFLPGTVPAKSEPPHTARQYRMDACFSFLIEVGGVRILADSGKRQPLNIPADVLIIHPFYSAKHYQRLLVEIQPKLVIPNHWDNFMPTLSRDISHDLFPKDYVSGLVRRWFLPRLSKTIENTNPNVKVLVPQLFHEYNLNMMIE